MRSTPIGHPASRLIIRAPVDAARVRAFVDHLGRRTSVEATVYLVGGASAVLMGWRATTRDVDLRVEPESATGPLGDVIADLKGELDISVEFASPPEFIPELPGWRDRSPFVERVGSITFRHFDFYSQALAKARRGIDADAPDVAAMLDADLIERDTAWSLFEAIVPEMRRYPAIDEPSFRARMVAAFGPRHH